MSRVRRTLTWLRESWLICWVVCLLTTHDYTALDVDLWHPSVGCNRCGQVRHT